MKRILAILVIVLAVLPWGRIVDAGMAQPRQGDVSLYERYAGRDGLTVAQIEGFRLNDSVKVDVVILQADDAQHWQSLCGEFDIRNSSGVATWTGEADNPENRVLWKGQPCCKVIASPARQTICFYRLENTIQYQSLMDYQLDLMMAEQ